MRNPLACLALFLLCGHPAMAQCNTPPEARPDTGFTLDNEVLWLDVLANDSDLDGQPLSIVLGFDDCPGLVASVGGFLRYTPTPLRLDEQTCTIDYEVSDGEDLVPSTVSVTVHRFIPEIFADGFESGDTSAWTLEGHEP